MVETRLKGINKVRKRLADGRVRIHHCHRATGRPLTGKTKRRVDIPAPQR